MAWLFGKSQETKNNELCEAAGHGDVDEIDKLIMAGANPNAFEGTGSFTPLQRASREGHAAAIAALREAGANVNGANGQGISPLMFAAANGQTAAIDALIAAGADVHRANIDGDTALHWASAWGRVDATRVLLEAGAKLDVRNYEGKRPIEVVRDRRDRSRSFDVVCEHRRSRHGVRCRRGMCRSASGTTRPTKPPCARC
jgi:uncharacterized protein